MNLSEAMEMVIKEEKELQDKGWPLHHTLYKTHEIICFPRNKSQ